MKDKALTYKVFSLLCIFISLFSLINNKYFNNIYAALLLIHNIYSVIVFKDNKKTFFLTLVITYFNYGIVICKYLFGGTILLEGLYSQINSLDLGINITLLLLFNSLMFYIISSIPISKDCDKNKNSTKYHVPKILLFFKIIIILVLAYHIIYKITDNTSIFEYLILIFIFAFYFSKGNKKEQRKFEVLMIICAIYQLYVGERISILQFFLADFLINYVDVFSRKKTCLIMATGIVFFTVMGIYGDILDYVKDFNAFSLNNIYSQFSSRRFALDTSVSSYFTSATFVSMTKHYDARERLSNGYDYFTKYLFLGSKSKYTRLTALSRPYYVHYGGGMIYSFFYFWFGTIGVIFISCFIGLLYKSSMSQNKKYSQYRDLLIVYLITTVPRWYLYEPSLLFRGLILFTIMYFCVFLLIKKQL